MCNGTMACGQISKIDPTHFPVVNKLQVHCHFDGVSDGERAAFMRFFDRYTPRGGG